MASSRPASFLPEWASSGSVLPISGQQNRVRPTLGHRQDGWAENEEPPCNFENYNGFSTYEFLRFFDLNVIRSATAFVCASNATDPMKDLATSEGIGLNKWMCDGVDDTAEIQDAVDAVEVAGGGLVLLSEGTFELITPIFVDSDNVVIAGMGRGSTILRVPSGAAIQFDVITLATVSNCAIKNLAIDGNDAGQSGSLTFNGIVLDNASHCLVQDVSVHDLYDSGVTANAIQIKGGSSANNIIARCRTFSNTVGITDIEVTAGSGTVISKCRCTQGILTTAADTRISDNIITGGPYGILASSGGTGSQIHANHITGAGIGIDNVSGITVQGNRVSGVSFDGILLDTAHDLSVVGNHISLCGSNGIYLLAVTNSLISSNQIDSCSQAGDDTYDGISVRNDCADVSIVANQIRTKGAPPEHQYGLYVESAGANQPFGIWVDGNDFRLASHSGNIKDDSNNTVFPGGGNNWDGAVAPAVTDFNRV